MTDTFNSHIQSIGSLPLIKYYMDQLDLYSLLDRYVPNDTGTELPPAQVLSMLIMNLLCAPSPLYHIPEWLGQYVDGQGETLDEANKFNDDRCGRTLDRLFKADRNSLLTELSAQAIKAWGLQTSVMHNDTTSITLIGGYDEPHPDAVQPRHGHNKDHRPDCKQIVFGLNVTADGHVPLGYKLYDGNQSDSTTHRMNWQSLRELLGKEDFVYVADSKLCSQENLDLIAQSGGSFITVMPRTRKEAKAFIRQVEEGFDVPWEARWQRPNGKKTDKGSLFQLYEPPELDRGYRTIWIHSSAKASSMGKKRNKALEKAETSLRELSPKLNHYQLKSRQQIETALKKALGPASPYMTVTLTEQRQSATVKKGRGRPGPNSQFETQETIIYQLSWQRNDKAIEQAERSDGLFPLSTHSDLSPVEVLQHYKEQPHLEKRFLAGKSVLEIAPIYLKSNRRIEAMMLLFYIALMIVSLIERAIRQQMAEEKIKALPIRPGRMKTEAPTWRVICQFFTPVSLAFTLRNESIILNRELKGLSELHQQVLTLLGIPIVFYQNLGGRWWTFRES